MDLSHFASLFALTFLNAIAPGPGILFVTGIAARFGALRAARVASGIVFGTALLFGIALTMTLGLVNLNETAVRALQFAGVAVLAWLAILLWPRPTREETDAAQSIETRLFWTGTAMALSQPMSLIFLLAIVPQFLTSGKAALSTGLLAGALVMAATAAAMGLAACLGQSISRPLTRHRITLQYALSAVLMGFSGLCLLSLLTQAPFPGG